MFVEDVHKAIRCELISSVHEAQLQAATIASLRQGSSAQPKSVDFFETWGVKYTLTLKVVENFSARINVGGNSNPTPNPGDTVATIGVGFAGSAKATRTETDQSFSTVKLYGQEKKCPPMSNKIVPDGSGLGLGKWMRTRIGLVDSAVIGSITEQESFNFQAQFDIARTGSLSPAWTFVQRELASVSTPISGARSTVHSILVTLGPTNAARTKLAEDAAAIHNAIILGNFVQP